MKIKYTKSIVRKFDKILARGLCSGVGDRNGQMCIEAAICATLDLPHGDDPECVSEAVRAFKIALNDSGWSSPEARAKGLRDLGLAQIGSKGVVDDVEFSKILSEKVIRKMIPDLFRRFKNPEMDKAADVCESEGTESAAWSAMKSAAEAAEAAARSAWSAMKSAQLAAESAESAESAAEWSAEWSAESAKSARLAAAWSEWSAAESAEPDYFLNLVAKLALEVLVELKSPGVKFLSL